MSYALAFAVISLLLVDNTIHFMHYSKQSMNSDASVNSAIGFTLHTGGKAMSTTAIVLCCGFIIYTFSQMNNLDTFGAFTAVAIAMALLADFLLVPALMVVSHKQEHQENKNV